MRRSDRGCHADAAGSGIWWLVSYPKSGNTWLRAAVATLVSGQPADINAMSFLGGSASARNAFDHTLAIESVSLSFEQETNLRPRAYETWAAEAKQPLYYKVHDAYHLTPAGEPLFPAAATRGAVYIVRDPRAVAVSFAHHTAQPIDAAIARMENPDATVASPSNRLSDHLRQRLLRWSGHVESWLAAPFPVHLMRYEDMQRDPHAAFKAVAAFLELPCEHDAISAAVAAATFSRLQAQERTAGFVEKPREAAIFFREGKVDGWRRALTPEQAARIVAAHGAVMRRLGYDVALAPFVPERGAA
jgi:aryl sulfotransferase